MAMFDSLTTRMPNGVTNAASWQTMGASGREDPTWSHMYANDFDTFAAGDFTIATVTSGSPTQALTDGDGGRLLVTNTAGATDATYLQLKNAGFQLKLGKATFFKFAGQMSDLVNGAYFGLVQKGAAAVGTITDGVYITKASGTGALTLNSAKTGTTTQSVAFPAAEAIVAATDFELGIYVDYLGNLAAFFNPTTGSNPISASAAASTNQARGRVAALYAGPALAQGQTAPLVLTAALLTPAFGLLNASAIARTLNVDYLVASRER